MKKDKYRWTDADICLKCTTLTPLPKGNGLRYVLCNPCVKKLKEDLKNWKKNGLYAVAPEGDNKDKPKKT